MIRYADSMAKHSNSQSGFSLIEILIALLIFSMGLLGLAELQLKSLKNQQGAYQKTLEGQALQNQFEQQTGKSLLEVLIALTLGIMITTMAGMVWSGIKATDRQNEALARLQEQGRFLNHLVGHDIRQAGFIGCRRLDASFNVYNNINDSRYELNQSNALMIYKSNQWPSHLQKIALKDSDVLEIRYLDPMEMVSLEQAVQKGKKIRVPLGSPLEKEKIGIISDCSQAELFKVVAVKKTSSYEDLILSNDLRFSYAQDALVGLFVQRDYFLADTGRHTLDGFPIHGLYREDLDEKKRELMSDVESLKIHQEEIPFKRLDSHLRRNDVIAHHQLTLYFLLKSPFRFSSQTTRYVFLNEEFVDPKGYLYKEWSIILTPRNLAY